MFVIGFIFWSPRHERPPATWELILFSVLLGGAAIGQGINVGEPLLTGIGGVLIAFAIWIFILQRRAKARDSKAGRDRK
jgi:hypothetical protein